MHEAAAKGDDDVVKSLLGVRAPVDAKDDRGNTPLHLACQNGHFGVSEKLIEERAPLDWKNSVILPNFASRVSLSNGDNVLFLNLGRKDSHGFGRGIKQCSSYCPPSSNDRTR